MKRAGQFDVVDIAPFPREEFEILTPPQRLADIFDRGGFQSWRCVSEARD